MKRMFFWIALLIGNDAAISGATCPKEVLGDDVRITEVALSPQGDELALVGNFNHRYSQQLVLLDIREQTMRAVTTSRCDGHKSLGANPYYVKKSISRAIVDELHYGPRGEELYFRLEDGHHPQIFRYHGPSDSIQRMDELARQVADLSVISRSDTSDRGRFHAPTPSPRGDLFAYIYDPWERRTYSDEAAPQVFLWDRSAQKSFVLTEAKSRYALHGDDYLALRPLFSPDGRYLAFRGDYWDRRKEGKHRLYLYNTQTKRKIVIKPGEDTGDFSFSPDSRKLAYVVNTDFWGSQTLGEQQLWLLDLQSRESQMIPSAPQGRHTPDKISRPLFAPDGSFMLYQADHRRLYKVALDAPQRKGFPLPTPKGQYWRDMIPLFITPNGETLLYLLKHNLWAYDLATKQVKPLIDRQGNVFYRDLQVIFEMISLEDTPYPKINQVAQLIQRLKNQVLQQVGAENGPSSARIALQKAFSHLMLAYLAQSMDTPTYHEQAQYHLERHKNYKSMAQQKGEDLLINVSQGQQLFQIALTTWRAAGLDDRGINGAEDLRQAYQQEQQALANLGRDDETRALLSYLHRLMKFF